MKFENENVAGSHFIAEAHQICMLSKHSEWATREKQVQLENSKEREWKRKRKSEEMKKKASEHLQKVLEEIRCKQGEGESDSGKRGEYRIRVREN